MLQTSQLYRQLGIREEVLAFADNTEKQLKTGLLPLMRWRNTIS